MELPEGLAVDMDTPKIIGKRIAVNLHFALIE
jgi:hypothetical protein